MVTISAVILTKNEEINLERCITSLQWCDEIVVLDSGSVDQTVPMAETLGTITFTHIQPAPFNIAEQRNWALEHCGLKGDWVLFIDADETIPPALAKEIQKVCADGKQSCNAFELTPKYWFWGTWLKRTQGYPNWHARLLKKGEVVFTGGVWEHFAPGATVGRIAIPYDHFAHSKGFSDWLERHDRYSSWDAEHILKFLNTGDANALATERKLKLRTWAARLWPLRPLFRFGHMYFLRLGLLEGKNALIYCLLCAWYEWMVVVKVLELKRKQTNLPL